MQIKVISILLFFFSSFFSFCQSVDEYGDFIPYYFEHKDLNKIKKVIFSKIYTDSVIDAQRDSLAYLGDNWGGVLLDTAFNLKEMGYKLKKDGKTFFYLRIFAEDALSIAVRFDKQSFIKSDYIATIWDIGKPTMDYDYISLDQIPNSNRSELNDYNIYFQGHGDDIIVEYCLKDENENGQDVNINGLYYYFK